MVNQIPPEITGPAGGGLLGALVALAVRLFIDRKLHTDVALIKQRQDGHGKAIKELNTATTDLTRKFDRLDGFLRGRDAGVGGD